MKTVYTHDRASILQPLLSPCAAPQHNKRCWPQGPGLRTLLREDAVCVDHCYQRCPSGLREATAALPKLCFAASRSSPDPQSPENGKSLHWVLTSPLHARPWLEQQTGHTWLVPLRPSRSRLQPQERHCEHAHAHACICVSVCLLVDSCSLPFPLSTPRGTHHLPYTHAGSLHHGSVCNGSS